MLYVHLVDSVKESKNFVTSFINVSGTKCYMCMYFVL